MDQYIGTESAESLPLEFFFDCIPCRPVDRFAGNHDHSPFTIPVPVTATVDAVLGIGELPVTGCCELIVAAAAG